MRYKWAWVALFALLGATPLAAQEGTVLGQVLDSSTNEPLTGVQVYVEGTNLGALTNEDGRYMIRQVPAGEHEVRAALIGYSTVGEDVTVVAGETLTQDFRLRESAIELGAVVVSATGQQQTKREIGSSVGVIQVEDVEMAPVKSFSDLLQGRTPGLTVVRAGGTSGAGSRVRIRGSNSMSLSNDPLLIIDGVRVENSQSSFGLFTGGQTTSRLNDLNPDDIENIEVLKGPAASALYGTAAANGVIQVTTRKGTAGTSSWKMWTEGSTMALPLEFPDNVMAVDGSGLPCTLQDQAAGTCTVSGDVLTSNPLEDEAVTPFRDGTGFKYGASVSGGSDDATYYISAEREEETGILEENSLERTNLRANVTGFVSEDLSVGARVGYTGSDIQLPQNDNSALGILPNGLTAPPTPFYVDNWDGFGLPRDYLFAWDQNQDLTRLTLSGNASWNPLPWLSMNGTAGLDQVNRHDNSLIDPNVLMLFGPPFSTGFRESWRVNDENQTANGNATMTFDLLPGLVSATSFGMQYNRAKTHAIYAFGSGITPGTGSLSGASTGYEADETNIENVTLGTYVQERLTWRDRIYLTGALRGDRNSAFGTNLGWVWYPAVSGSWIVSEEDFFPDTDVLSSLRLRGAWGQSGLRPTFRQALQFFAGVTAATVTGEVPGFVIAGAGNPDLEPEISTEMELGLEADLLRGRAGLELTWYKKNSTDALVAVPLPPSFGATATRMENIGEMENTGVEAALNVTPVSTRDVNWDFRVSLATNDNEVTSLGGAEPIIFGLLGSTQRHQVGHPAGSYFQRPIESFEDANGDGIIEASEVVIGDSATYVGQPFPTAEMTASSTLDLWNMLQLSALVDYKSGHQIFNATMWDRCDAGVCEERYIAGASLEDQARWVAYDEANTVAGFIEDADFVKLREVSLTMQVPETVRAMVGASDMRFTVAGNNLVTWTDYSGFEPEVNGAGQDNYATFDFRTLPPLRMWTLRLDVSF
ncbi:MAG: SusC/RagA family TonB-linked outer membrane protein [Longimicrobiales bacterium]